MDNPKHQRIREAIESCQPGSDDLRSADVTRPELSDAVRALATDASARTLRSRVESWDRAIGRTMDNVAVPAGLEQRILARLAAAGAQPAPLTASVAAATGTVPVEASAGEVDRHVGLAEPPAGANRVRYWSGIGVAAIVAAVLVVVAGYWLQLGADEPLDRLAERWQSELTDQWQPIGSQPGDFPYPTAMRAAATGWQWIGRFTPTPVVAYRLTDGKTSGLLYAARMAREELGTSPPRSPQRDTGGQAVGYWRSGEVVYVLVVNDVQRYRAFVRPMNAPLALLLPFGQEQARRSSPRQAMSDEAAKSLNPAA